MCTERFEVPRKKSFSRRTTHTPSSVTDQGTQESHTLGNLETWKSFPKLSKLLSRGLPGALPRRRVAVSRWISVCNAFYVFDFCLRYFCDNSYFLMNTMYQELLMCLRKPVKASQSFPTFPRFPRCCPGPGRLRDLDLGVSRWTYVH